MQQQEDYTGDNKMTGYSYGALAVDAKEVAKRVLKYLLESSMVAIAVALVPQNKLKAEEVFVIALVAAASFAILDLFAPAVGRSARTGAGFGIGASLTGWPGGVYTH